MAITSAQCKTTKSHVDSATKGIYAGINDSSKLGSPRDYMIKQESNTETKFRSIGQAIDSASRADKKLVIKYDIES